MTPSFPYRKSTGMIVFPVWSFYCSNKENGWTVRRSYVSIGRVQRVTSGGRRERAVAESIRFDVPDTCVCVCADMMCCEMMGAQMRRVPKKKAPKRKTTYVATRTHHVDGIGHDPEFEININIQPNPTSI